MTGEERGIGPPYFVVVVQVGAGPTVHVVPGWRPRSQPRAHLITRAGPFPAMVRAIAAQQYLAQEWCCPRVAPAHDAFVQEYWGDCFVEGRGDG